MSEIERLRKTIATVDAQRPALGDAAVEPVLAGLRQQLAQLEAAERRQRRNMEQTTQGERRIVTVLLCDVKGSTALAERLDPETWTEIMDEAFDLFSEPVARYGGTVAQLLGDGLLAFFGVPKAHDDDPQRAVLAGLAILENIQPIREKLRRERGLDFNVRIGVNTGLVVTGMLGSQRHEEYQALGEGVNLAALMEKTARPGSVHVSEHTYRLAAAGFDFEEVDPVEVEANQKRIRAYRVKGRRMDRGMGRGLTTYGISSPLIERDAEFQAAQTAVSRLLNGEGGILIINGEAGIGKSRLVAELERAVRGRNLTWLTGRTLFFGQSIAYHPFQEILRAYMGIGEEDSDAVAWAKLEKSVQALFPKAGAEIVPYLANIMALEARGDYVEKVKYLDGEAMGEQILVATRRFFKRLAQKAPLVLVFEDLQWVDPSSVRLMERLLKLVDQTQVLLCGVSRPERNEATDRLREVTMNNYAARTTEIFLHPLSDLGSEELVEALLDSDDLSLRAREMIVQKADGNPFFVEEIIRDLIDKGAITKNGNSLRWQATSRLEWIEIPDTIQGVITSRIDRLDYAVKRVLRAAAVIGQSFHRRILAAVLDAEEALDKRLNVLQRAEIISLKQRAPEMEYVFIHSLAQEVTYNSTLLQKRRSLHARVGEAIESLFADRLEEFYGLLAYHFAQAEAWEPAQKYLLKAGDQASLVAAGAEALAHYKRALQAYDNAFGLSWNALQRAELARKMGDAYYGLGRLPESQKYYQDALQLLDRSLPQSRSRLFLGLAGQIVRQALHYLLPGRFLDSAPAEARDTAREVVRSYERLGVIYYIQGEAASSIYTFLRSLNLAEPAGPTPELARAYANNVIAAGLIPPIRFMADRYSQRALQTAAQGDDLAALAWVLQLTSINNTGLGRWSAVMEAAAEAAEINKRIGRLRWWEESSSVLAQALHFYGHYLRSIKLYEQILDSAEERGDQQTQIWALAGLVETHMRRGEADHKDLCLLYMGLARSLSSEYRYPNRPDEIQVFGLSAQVYFRRQEWKPALEAAKRASELIESEWPPSTYYTFESYAGLPEVFIGLCQAEEQGQLRGVESGDLRKAAERACHNLLNFARVFPFARPRSALWQGNLEWLRDKKTQAHSSWQKSLGQAVRLDLRYDEGRAHLEIGEHLPVQDPSRKEHLEQACQIFTDLGAGWDLARAQEALDS